MVMLFTIPAVGYMSLVYGALGASQTVMITTLSQYMTEPPYNFNESQIGLMSVPGWVGTTLGSLVFGPLSDWSVLWLSKRNGGIYEPEMRLWLMAAGIPFIPAGIFMFGFGLHNGASWPVLAVGAAIANFGIAPASSVALTYLTDAYTEIIADSLVGTTFTRNAISTIFVFALSPWISGVGMKNVYVTIGIIEIAVMLCCSLFIIYGKRWRQFTAERYKYYASRQFTSIRPSN